MRYLILFLLPIFSFGQAIVGQAVFTQPQLDEMDSRLDAGGLYVDTNSGSSGFYGDGSQIESGAEQFLNEEEGVGFADRWTWMSTADPILDYNTGTFEPSPVFSNAGAATLNVEYIHYAAVLSAVWNGRTDVVTFSGQTKTKDAHALDLAQAVLDVLVLQYQRTELDYGDVSRYVRNNADGNPHFIAIAKMSKYIRSYALVYDQLSGYAPYTTHKSGIESWFYDAYDFAYERHRLRVEAFFGSSWRDFTANSYPSTTDYGGAGNHQSHAYFNSGGTGFLEVSSAQASGLNNRTLDFLSYVGTYAVHFNNATAKAYVWDYFQLMMKMGVFSDGTYNEWYRNYDTGPDIGIQYATLSLFKLTAEAYQHAVAFQNGLPGVTDQFKYFDYTTSEGSDELYSSYPSGSTSGGAKGLELCLENMSKYYRNTANGGWNDVRFAEGGNAITEENRPFTAMAAMANTYYDNATIEAYYKLSTGSGYGGMDYYGSTNISSTGAWTEHSLGLSWGEAGTFGGYWGLSDMEGIVFSGTISSVVSNNKRNFYRKIYDN